MSQAPTTILLVEDDHFLRALAVEILEGSGHVVLPVGSSAVAATLAKQHPGKIDLLVTDVAMAGGSGPELAAEVRRLRPGVKVLFISGYSRGNLAVRGISDDDILLSKPFSPAELSAAVATVLGR